MIIYGEHKPKPVFKSNVGLTTENTWLIFGCSPYINIIKQHVPFLLKNYRSIGLNAFPCHFAGCEFLTTIDKNNFFKNYSGSKFILGWGKNNEIYKEHHKNREIAYIFNSVDDPVLEDSFKWTNRENFEFNLGKLLCRHTVALPAINYALLQKAKNIVLIGVDFSSGWQHYYDKSKSINMLTAHHRKHRQNKMLSSLSKLNKHVNIYNLNPNTETNVPIINIGELNV